MASSSIAKRELLAMDRQRKILQYLREDPSLTNGQLSKMLGVTTVTITKDLRALSEEFRSSNAEGWEVHRDRLLKEIRMNKAECMRRLRNVSDHQGSRWMEEWSKLTAHEMKILGVGNNETITLEKGKSFDKREHDAAINAMIKLQQAGIDVLDADFEDVPALPEPEPVASTVVKPHTYRGPVDAAAMSAAGLSNE